MKTMKKFLSMAALAMVGAVMTGCSSEDNVIDQAQTATKNNVVTQTVTVGFDEQAATRALAIDYDAKTLTKTFAEGDQIAVIYQNTSGTMVKETVTIAAGDISTNGKSAKFTVTMTNPKASGTLKYIYPAAMAGATDVNYTKLNSQNGTLASLASNLDLAVYDGTLTAEKALPASATLENKLAILALTIKDNATTPNDITSTIMGMNIIAGTNSYTITGKDADGHIYAAIQPTSGANISCFATTASGNYTKSLTSKTYAANNIYNLGLKMDDATTVGLGDATTDPIVNGSTLYGLLTSNVKISIADGAIVTLKGVTINNNGWTDGDYAGITCEGSATIILEGENTVKGFNASYPGIYVPEGKTLTIMGSGSLNASSNGSGSGAGIGGCENGTCGNIVIKGGEITATGGANGGAGIGGASNGTCGNITISGGTITATGGMECAGIGGGKEGTCSAITISGGTVTATGGYGGAGIGGGYEGSCDNITISCGTITATGGDNAAGIGGGYENYACGTITITSGVTKVEATKGSGAPNSIGKGNDGEDITVTIDGVANATTSSEFPHFTSEVSGNTWTLTHK